MRAYAQSGQYHGQYHTIVEAQSYELMRTISYHCGSHGQYHTIVEAQSYELMRTISYHCGSPKLRAYAQSGQYHGQYHTIVEAQSYESLCSKRTISYHYGESCSSNMVTDLCPKLSRVNRLVNPQMLD